MSMECSAINNVTPLTKYDKWGFDKQNEDFIPNRINLLTVRSSWDFSRLQHFYRKSKGLGIHDVSIILFWQFSMLLGACLTNPAWHVKIAWLLACHTWSQSCVATDKQGHRKMLMTQKWPRGPGTALDGLIDPPKMVVFGTSCCIINEPLVMTNIAMV